MRLTPYVASTPLINLIKKTKYYRDIFIDWVIDYQVLLDIDLPESGENADEEKELRKEIESIVKKITFISFRYQSHQRLNDYSFNKSEIYESIADLIYALDEGEGLEYKRNVLYRYISDPKHSNVHVDPIILGAQVRAVYYHKYKREEI